MPTLDQQEVEDRLQELPWRRDGKTIVRELGFEDFAAAIAFVNAVAQLAEQANHHPDIYLHDWNKVTLTLSTHSEGGITQADFDLAAQIDAIQGVAP